MRWLLIALLLTISPAAAQNTLFSATPGDMIYRGSAGWQPVPSGSAGQILMSNGAAAAPTWTYGWGSYTTAPIILPQIPTNRALMNVTGSNAAPTAGTASQFLDTIGYDTLRPPGTGAMLYKDGTTGTWQATTGGANAGSVMTMQSNGVAAWLAPTGGVYIATGALGTCLVSTGTTTAPAYSSCLSATSLSATLPLTATFGAVQTTIDCPTCATDSDIRVRLTTDTTYNVPADFATFCAATDYLNASVDGGGHNVTIQIADGTYTAGCYIRSTVGINKLTVQGNLADKTAVTLNPSGGLVLQTQEVNTAVIEIKSFTVNVAGTTPAIGIYHSTVASISDINWIGTANDSIAFGTSGGTNVNLTGAHSVAATGTNFLFITVGDNGYAELVAPSSLTFVGTPAATSWFYARAGGVFSLEGATIVNGAAATGGQYFLTTYAALNLVNSTGALPGTTFYNDGSGIVVSAANKLINNLPLAAVNDLPTCTLQLIGSRYIVFDNNTALSFGDVISTGGSIIIPVFCNGSSWRQG